MTSSGLPLKCPALRTSTILPCMPASAGITTVSLTMTGEARLATKVSPGRLIPELTDSVNLTLTKVPVGTVTCSGGTGIGAPAATGPGELLGGAAGGFVAGVREPEAMTPPEIDF